MTDTLDRALSTSLRRAAGDDYDAAAAAASFPLRRAARVRTRRAGGVAGVGLAIAMGALAPAIAANLSADDRTTLNLSASPSAPAVAPAATQADDGDVRVVRKPCESSAPLSSPGAEGPAKGCGRMVYEFRWPGEPMTASVIQGTPAPASPGTLVLELHDGTKQSYPPRPAGQDAWDYDVRLPERSQVRTFALTSEP